MIKIAMNGGRSKTDNVAVPVSVEDYCRELPWFLEQGVTNFHIHFRGPDGLESLKESVIEPQFRRLKERFPLCNIGIGSPLQNGVTAESRKRHIQAWNWVPDYISLNLSEEGSLELAPLLNKKMVPIEFGIFSMEDAIVFKNNQL